MLGVRAWVGSETGGISGIHLHDIKDWHRRRDDEVFRVWSGWNLKVGKKCWPFSFSSDQFCASVPDAALSCQFPRSLLFFSCSPVCEAVAFLLLTWLTWGFFLSFFLSHNWDSFYPSLKYPFDTIFFPFWILKVKLNLTVM